MRIRIPYSPAFSSLLATCLSLSACGGNPDDPGHESPAETDVASGSQPLNGQVTYVDSSCNAFKPTINAAMLTALFELSDGRMTDCLSQAIFSFTETGFAERILSEMRASMPTKVNCKTLKGRLAEAAPSSSESVTYDIGFISTATVGTVAAVTLHEVAHNKGYKHAIEINSSQTLAYNQVIEYPHTVPEQIRQCATQIGAGVERPVPNGGRLDALARETLLGATGGSGGTPLSLDCAFPNAAVGMDLRTDTEVVSFGLSCASFGGTPGPFAGPAGGSGGTFTFRKCIAGQFMVGVHGRAWSRNNAIAPLCQDLAGILNGSNGFRAEPLAGGTGGEPYLHRCPPRMVVRGVRVRSGSKIDRLQPECVDVSGAPHENVPLTNLALRGTPSGVWALEKCAGRAALTGIGAHIGTGVIRLDGQCGIVTTGSCSGGTCTDTIGVTHHVLPGHGNTGGVVTEESCPTGSVVVGLTTRSGAAINAVGAICANAAAWSRSGPFTSTNLPVWGGPAGTLRLDVCPTGTFMTGWLINHSGAGVNALQPICRNFLL
jgi:hypothetical protein